MQKTIGFPREIQTILAAGEIVAQVPARPKLYNHYIIRIEQIVRLTTVR